MLRLFIGIPLPGSHQNRLQELARQLDALVRSRVRWTNTGNGHLTLKFLGSVDEGKVGDLAAALAEVEFSPYDVRLGPCTCYPKARQPKVVVMPVHKGARLCQNLATLIQKNIGTLGFPPGTKPFNPHLTIGRIKKPAPDDWDDCFRATETLTWPGFHVDRFVLWSSDLTSDGPIYTPLHTFMLD